MEGESGRRGGRKRKKEQSRKEEMITGKIGMEMGAEQEKNEEELVMVR